MAWKMEEAPETMLGTALLDAFTKKAKEEAAKNPPVPKPFDPTRPTQAIATAFIDRCGRILAKKKELNKKQRALTGYDRYDETCIWQNEIKLKTPEEKALFATYSEFWADDGKRYLSWQALGTIAMRIGR